MAPRAPVPRGPKTFGKIAETPEQLLARFVSRGVSVNDSARALLYIKRIGNFRLKGYWYHLQDKGTKKVRVPVTFDDIIDRYEFDRELRTLVFDELSHLEIVLRTTISDALSLAHGPHWYDDPSAFRSPHVQQQNSTSFLKDVGKVGGPFVESYERVYATPNLPPSWGVFECLTFGTWSQTYGRIKDGAVRKNISMVFGVEEFPVFASWLHSLSVLRNSTCHHCRLLKAKRPFSPHEYKKAAIEFPDNRDFFAPATVMAFMLKNAGMASKWKPNLQGLFSRYPKVPPAELGFPTTWETHPGWV